MGKKAWEDIIIVETDNIPGKKIIKTLGKVKTKVNTGEHDIMKHAKFRWEQAPIKLRKMAHKLGANGIIEVRYGYKGMDMVGEDSVVIIEEID